MLSKPCQTASPVRAGSGVASPDPVLKHRNRPVAGRGSFPPSKPRLSATATPRKLLTSFLRGAATAT